MCPHCGHPAHPPTNLHPSGQCLTCTRCADPNDHTSHLPNTCRCTGGPHK